MSDEEPKRRNGKLRIRVFYGTDSANIGENLEDFLRSYPIMSEDFMEFKVQEAGRDYLGILVWNEPIPVRPPKTNDARLGDDRPVLDEDLPF